MFYIIYVHFRAVVKTKELKEVERQMRRDAKRTKAMEKEAKFKKIMMEKKASGEWVEKSKWKSMERKAAASKKQDNPEHKSSENSVPKDIVPKTSGLKKREKPRKRPNKKREKVKSESEEPGLKKAKVEE